jgi:thiamine biosynthesis protein ThiS
MKAADTIRIVINGEPREVAADLSVEDLLRGLDLHPKLVVVERNREILRRDAYARVSIEPDDELELVHFVGGG